MKKIFIWGTGRLIGKVVGKYISIEEVTGFIDSNKKRINTWGKK